MKQVSTPRRSIALALAATLSLATGPGHADTATALTAASNQYEKAEYRTAIITLKNLLQRDPGLIEARLLLGRTQIKLGNGADAEKELRRAADLGADPSEWRLDLAEALLQQSRFQDVFELLPIAELPEDEHAKAYALHGRGHLGLRQNDEARAAFAKAVELDPSDRLAGIGLAQLSLLADDLDAAADAADAMIARDPEAVDPLLLRAEVYTRQNATAEAAAIFTKVIEIEPTNLRALLGQATMAVRQQEFDVATETLDQIDAINADIFIARYLRGVVAFYERDWDRAGKLLGQVLAAQPGHIQSQLLMGVISYANDELRTADEYLSNAINALPDNQQARKVLAATRLKLREPERAIEALMPIAEQGDAQSMALLGSAYLINGDAEQGQQWLSRAVEAEPDVAALRTQLALSMIADGKMDQAISELSSAVDLGQNLIQADVLLVLSLLRENNYAEAIAAGHELEQRRPESPIAYNLTGLAHLAEGSFEAARERFDKALEVDPKFTTALVNLARVDLSEGKVAAATKRFERVLKRDPTNLAAMLGMAALAEQRGAIDEVETWLNKAVDAHPKAIEPSLLLSRFLSAQGSHLKAVTLANDLATRVPNSPQVLEWAASAAIRAGDSASALRTLDRLIELRPNDAQAYFLRGRALAQENDLAGAADALRQAVVLAPELVEPQVALASVLTENSRFAEAVDVARSLQRAYPDKALGYRLEGVVQRAARQPSAAAEAWEKAQAIAPGSETVRNLASAMVADGRTGQAIELLTDWIKDHSDDLASASTLALLLQGEERDDEALALYESLHDNGVRNIFLLNNMAWILQERGDARALELAREAYNLAPNRPEIADTYGWILFNSGERNKGLSILQQAHLAFPTQTEIAYHVAIALEAVGRGNEAVPILQRLLRERPDANEAPEARALLERLQPGGAG